jgi:KDO2-lipid IV(A) lauroyltransferase
MNLTNSFPAKNEKEISRIEAAFFRHLCDVIVESVKLFSISESELSSRFVMRNPEILHDYYKGGQNLSLVAGHYSNWEMAAISLDRTLPHQAVGIYSPLKNKYFNDKLAKSRTRFGVKIITKAEVRNAIATKSDAPTITVFGADQSPTYSKSVYWTKFLNQETAVAIGTELFAVKYNYPVFFMKVEKVKRGYYEAELDLLAQNPGEYQNGEITRLHTKHLEKIIRKEPQFWLWSHKRWKRKKTEKEKQVEIKTA